MQKEFYSIVKINDSLKNNALKVVRDAESSFRSQLFNLATDIVKKGSIRIVLMCGPSCAGKTTSAKLLKEVLEQKGKRVLNVPMDDFFKSRNERKILPDGSVDFDSFDVINIEQVKTCFKTLFTKNKAKFPEFDFTTGINKPNKHLYEITPETIIIIEGIHMFNPKFTDVLGDIGHIKVYVNNFTGFENKNLKITNQEFRLVRRLVRDNSRRGMRYAETLKLWKNICAAEDENINPYIDLADYKINTSHSYEMGLYKKDMLDAVARGELSYKNLPWLELFENAYVVDKSILPDTTLMHEFINL